MMNKFASANLMTKLMSIFVAVSLVPIIIVGVMNYMSARGTLKRQFLDHQEAIAQAKESSVALLMSMRMEQIAILAGDEVVQNLVNIWNTNRGQESMFVEVMAGEARNFIEFELPKFSDITPFYEYSFLGNTGEVYFSTNAEKVGQDLSAQKYVERVAQGTIVTDIKKDESGEPFFAVAAPIKHRSIASGEAIGVVVAKMRTTELDAIVGMQGSNGKGEEIYIVNSAGYMITATTGVPDAVLQQRVDTEPVQRFLKTGEFMSGIYENYRGETIVGVSAAEQLQQTTGLGWLVLSEVRVSEAFAGARMMGVYMVLVAVLISLVVAYAARILAGRIADPIKHISRQIERVSEGDLTVEVPVPRSKDEVGKLAESFRRMVESSRTTTREIQQSVQVLATSVNEISSSTSQLSAIATETATAVTETATTVEEIKQTAKISSDTANEVSESAQRAVEVSDTGKQSTEDTVAGIERIKVQMEIIAESIIRLNEQGQTIGDIISTVDDLSEQSNLLAVNAAIEAAKAGEHGKGFAVVAQEIKNLSNQSKQATQQVRTILNDIQRATRDSVAATEQGQAAVGLGVEQSNRAGESIVSLARNIDDAAHAAMQIVASSHEQLVGMDQVASAMEAINAASVQNVDAVNVLDVSSKKLRQLGDNLLELVEQTKV